MISNKLYDIFRFLVEIILPGLGVLYTTLAAIWGLPFATEIVGTIVAIALFLGLFLKYSSWKYQSSGAAYQGEIVVNRDPMADKPLELVFNEPLLNQVETNKVINLKVVEVHPDLRE